MNPRIKICGIKKPEDAFCCEELGADAIGLVFYPPSPRNVSIDQAAEIASSLPPFLTAVGLFVDPDETLVQQVLQDVRIDCLQFHGVESNDFCKQFARKWYKAIRAKSGVDLAAEAENILIHLQYWLIVLILVLQAVLAKHLFGTGCRMSSTSR